MVTQLINYLLAESAQFVIQGSPTLIVLGGMSARGRLFYQVKSNSDYGVGIQTVCVHAACVYLVCAYVCMYVCVCTCC